MRRLTQILLNSLRKRSANEAWRRGLSNGAEVRPHRVLQRERRHSPHIPAGVVQKERQKTGRVRFHHKKTPLALQTNRIISGDAPSLYLALLEKGSFTVPPISSERLDSYLKSHLIDPSLLRSDSFDLFMADRQNRLIALMVVYQPENTVDDGEEFEPQVEEPQLMAV
jgi:hypothetical protein